jgi:hypothetical protein
MKLKIIVVLLIIILLQQVVTASVFDVFKKEDTLKTTDLDNPNQLHGFNGLYQYYSGDLNHKYEEGWNLMIGLPEDIENIENIDFIYIYTPVSKKYLEMYPKHTLDDSERDANAPIIRNTALWFHANKPGEIKLKLYKYTSFQLLYKGWNIIGVGPNLIGKSLNSVKGNCKIKNPYHYNPSKGWIKIDLDTRITNELAGKGIAVQAEDKCYISVLE